MSHIKQLLEKIRAKLYRAEDGGRLKSLHGHLEEREREAHADFLDTHHSNGDHQVRVEHHAANFWHYFYPGEHPREVIANDPIGEHVYCTEDEHHQARQRMIDPSSAASIKAAQARVPNSQQIQQHWMYESMIGELAMEKKDYAQAEKHFRAVLSEAEKFCVPDQQLIKVLRYLARSLSAQGKYHEFEDIYEKSLVADSERPESEGHFPEEEELNHIACEYVRQGREEEAKELYQHVLTVLERVRGPKSAVVARCLSDFAGIYAKTEEWKKAEELLKQSIEITESSPTALSAEMATSLHNLGALYQKHNRAEEAQELFGRAMAILERHSSEYTSV